MSDNHQPQPVAPIKWYTVPTLAKTMRVRRDTILAWINSGELKAVNVSTGLRPNYRIDPADLELFKLLRSSRAAMSTPLGRRPGVCSQPQQTASDEHTLSPPLASPC